MDLIRNHKWEEIKARVEKAIETNDNGIVEVKENSKGMLVMRY